MKRIFLLFLSLALLFCAMTSTSVLAAGTALPTTDAPVLTDAYAYAITPDSKDWFTYSVKEKVSMLKIPASELESMTDAELVGALASYPYLVDIYLYGSGVSDGIEVVRTYCSALDELLNRDAGSEAIREYITKYATLNSLILTQADPHNNFRYFALYDILLSLCSTASSTSVSSRDTRLFVTTDCGSRVEVRAYSENDEVSTHHQWDQEVEDTYNVETLQVGSCLYNCHYFAWYLEGNVNAGPHYWMNNPGPYMTDNTYSQVFSGNLNAVHYISGISIDDVIFYGYPDDIYSSHSAICYQAGTSGAPIASVQCISKWGNCGVFKHAMGNVPAGYYTSLITAWRFNG